MLKKNKIGRRKETYLICLIIIALSIPIIIICTFALRRFMQHRWTDKLVIAIQAEDEKKVDELLDETFLGLSYNIDKQAYQPFPMSLFAECQRDIPLVYACKTGNYNIINSLIQAGANVNEVLEGRSSPLEEAIISFNYTDHWRNTYKVIDLLIQNGADVDCIGGYGSSVYELCAESIISHDGLYNDCKKTFQSMEEFVEEREKHILKIYTLLCENGKDSEEYMDVSLKTARDCNNYVVEKYILECKEKKQGDD